MTWRPSRDFHGRQLHGRPQFEPLVDQIAKRVRSGDVTRPQRPRVEISVTVSAADIVAAEGVSASTAHRWLRTITGRKKGDGTVLRCTMAEWERFRANGYRVRGRR